MNECNEQRNAGKKKNESWNEGEKQLRGKNNREFVMHSRVDQTWWECGSLSLLVQLEQAKGCHGGVLNLGSRSWLVDFSNKDQYIEKLFGGVYISQTSGLTRFRLFIYIYIPYFVDNYFSHAVRRGSFKARSWHWQNTLMESCISRWHNKKNGCWNECKKKRNRSRKAMSMLSCQWKAK